MEIAAALDRALGYFGRPYDFDFNFATDDQVVCSELVIRAYEPVGESGKGLRVPWITVAGRRAVPPTELVRLFANEREQADAQLAFVYFLDGREGQKQAAPGPGFLLVRSDVMRARQQDEGVPDLHRSGYVSRAQEIWYGPLAFVYDAFVRWCFLPLGGERQCRQWIAERVDVRPGHQVVSLCCGTGTTDRVLQRAEPRARFVGIDLGVGQIARARHLDRTAAIEYRVGDASASGLDANSFDRVVIVLALHEMPRALRLLVLREARRLCRPDGRVIAVEHAAMPPGLSKALRHLWWVYWLPGNPERRTTLELQRCGLADEMVEVGLTVLERRVTRPAWIEAVTAARKQDRRRA